jgi:hypothetical protein
MAALRLALICALGALLLTPQPAMAGGWWSHIDVSRSTVAPGQRVEVGATVAFSSTAAAEEARETGRFHVYLLRGFDDALLERAMQEADPRNWWSLDGAEAIWAGPVAINASDSNLRRARAAFTVPELPPATYHVMLCDAGCANPLPDVIPASGFTVVADPATAQMAQRIDGLEQRIRIQAVQLSAARRDAGRARAGARNARSAVRRLETTVSFLADQAASSPRIAPWTYAGWLVAGALAGALAVLVLRRRRSRTAPDAEWQPSDEELRELLSSAPQR